MHKPIAGESALNLDRVLQVSFVPTLYFAKDEQKGNAVKMAFGFAALVIVPAKEPQSLAYYLTYRGDKVAVVKSGNTAFTLSWMAAPKTESPRVF